MKIDGEGLFGDVLDGAGGEEGGIEEEFSRVCAEENSAMGREELKSLGDERGIVELNVEHLIHFFGAGDGGRVDDNQVVFFLGEEFLMEEF